MRRSCPAYRSRNSGLDGSTPNSSRATPGMMIGAATMAIPASRTAAGSRSAATSPAARLRLTWSRSAWRPGLPLGAEILGFLGPNGVGKTTTLRMLTTLLPIDEGSAEVAGLDVRRQPGRVRARIGYVSQLGGADELATGRENLTLQGRLYGGRRADVARRVGEVLQRFDLAGLADRRVRTYSGGQRRRLDVALGVVHEPEVLFLDEPSTGLDPQNRASLWDHIRGLRDRGTTVFLTTHYLDEADVLCDRIMIVDHGTVVAQGTPRALKQQVAGDAIVLTPLCVVVLGWATAVVRRAVA